MSMFNYKDFSPAQSAELMKTSQTLAVYGNISGIMTMPTESILDKMGKELLSDGFYSNKVDLALPDGWREVEPTQLHMPEDAKDSWGFYPIESPLTGLTTSGPQAKILEHRDENGEVDQISVVYAGTNSPVDVVDYFQVSENTIAPNMNPLLEKVKAYALENNLQGEDVLITGYSLGGGMTNIMAKNREQLADGFFNHSQYIGHESPYIYDDNSVVLNMGFENDVVYRVIGDEATLQDAIDASKPGLINPDAEFTSTFDNLVLYNDLYSTKAWDISPFTLLNPIGWNAHLSGLMTDAVSRIADSSYYEFTHQDSTVIVDGLSALKRWNTWVEDKATATSDHHGTPAFIIGTEYHDLLKGNISGDYIDAGAGDDKIQLGAGADRLDGGEGNDTLILSGGANNWDVYQYDADTYFLNAHDGQGLKQIENVENVEFQGRWFWQNDTRHVGDMTVAEATVGTEGGETLQGSTVFAGGGDDVLLASADSSNILHGGEGNDTLIASNIGSTTLYGAEGNDTLTVGKGDSVLSGGVGNDEFRFVEGSSHAVITDFNAYSGDGDVLSFANQLFESAEDLSAVASQQGDDVLIAYNDFSVTVQNSQLDDVLAQCSIW